MWLVLVRQVRYFNSELGARNAEFFNRVRAHQKKFKLHEKTMNVGQQDINKWVAGQSKRQLTQKIVRTSNYDFDVKDYISKFNQEHQGRINLLDFSNYSTKFNDFKENPISKKDMDIIREFQKRKIDERVHYLNKNRFEQGKNKKNPIEYQKDFTQNTSQNEKLQVSWGQDLTSRQIKYENKKGWFQVDDDFIMILIQRNTSTKVTTLNRINFFRTVLFMGNGNGLISYGKSRELTPQASLTKAVIQCKKNIIAIPLDKICSMPREINSRFQDFHIYLRPSPGYNSWGHPLFSLMLSLSGISHAAFTTVHTGKNNYTLLQSYFKAVTQNTTPQQLAQKQGFKYYRRRFIRPLTQHKTHQISY